MRRLILSLLLVCLATAAYATPCAESPSGQYTCDKFVARNLNPDGVNASVFYPNTSASSTPTCTTTDNFKVIDLVNTADSSQNLWAMCGTTQVVTGSDDVVRQIVKGASGQTANLSTWTNSSDAVLASVSIAGEVYGSAQAVKVSAVSSSRAAAVETVLLCNATSAAVTITLPSASAAANRVYYVKKTDSTGHTCTVAAAGGETIDGQSNQIISFQYTTLQLVSDGSAWWIL